MIKEFGTISRKDAIMQLEGDIGYSERQVLAEVESLRSKLDRIELDVKGGKPNAMNCLQGNDWRLTMELTKLESLKSSLEQIRTLE